MGTGSAFGSAALELELSAMSDSADEGVLGSARFDMTPIGSVRKVVEMLADPAYLLLVLSCALTE